MGQNEKQTGKCLPRLACGNTVKYENVSQTQRQSQTAPKHRAGVRIGVCTLSSEKHYTVKNGSYETYFKKKKVKRKYFRKKTMIIIKIWR